MRTHHRFVSLALLLAASAVACGGPAEDDAESTSSALVRTFPGGPIVIGPIQVSPILPPAPSPDASLVVSNRTDASMIVGEANVWFNKWFPANETDSIGITQWKFGDALKGPDFWGLQAQTTALAQMYDLVAPIDPDRANTYLNRLHIIASTLLALRDDHVVLDLDQLGCRAPSPPAGCQGIVLSPDGHPIDAFRGRPMKGWGGVAKDRDMKWNNDILTTGMFVYAMTAFARRVADNPGLQGHMAYNGATYGNEALRFIAAALETYGDFRSELYLEMTPNDPWAYYKFPEGYRNLTCANGESNCFNYKSEAGQYLAWNENLSMMKALSDLALASNTPLFLNSPGADWLSRYYSMTEAPLVVSKNVRFFDEHLRIVWDDALCYEWDHQLAEPVRMQDTSHGNFEIGLYAAIHEDKPRLDSLLAQNGRLETIPIDPTQLTWFANTFDHRLVVTNEGPVWLHGKINGDDTGKDERRSTDGFLALDERWVWQRSLEMAYEDPVSGLQTNETAEGLLTVANHAALIRYKVP